MEMIHITQSTEYNKPTTIGLGNFDGVHIGHEVLVEEVIKHTDTKSSMLIFTEHTNKTLFHKTVSCLTSMDDKLNILKNLGIEVCFIINFQEDIAHLSAENFVKEYLIDKMKVKRIVVGSDYRFGEGATGDIALLKELSSKYNFDIIIVDEVSYDDNRVSSTRIKNELIQGDLLKANDMLGYNYRINGTVEHGLKRGRKMGFPTANIKSKFPYVVPKSGVYYTKTTLGNEIFHSLTNIGNNPTFDDIFENKIETFILDFNREIYGEKIITEFISYIRPELKFDSISELIQQMNDDIKSLEALKIIYNT